MLTEALKAIETFENCIIDNSASYSTTSNWLFIFELKSHRALDSYD